MYLHKTIMHICIFLFTAHLAQNTYGANNELIGLWHLQGMSCESTPIQMEVLKPLPFSNFHPDMYLSIQTESSQWQTFRVGKSVTTKSCTNSLAAVYQNALLSQTYFIETIVPSPKNPNHAVMTGVKIDSSWANPDISAGDCDTPLALLQYILPLEDYANTELNRVYELQLDYSAPAQTKLKAIYKEKDNFLCPNSDDKIILTFKKL